MDFFDDFMNDLPQVPLIGQPHHIPPIIDEFMNAFMNLPQIPLIGQPLHIPPIIDEFMNAFMNLPQIPLLRLPHLIPRLNGEEDDEIEVDAVDVPIPAHAQPLPVYGPGQVFEADRIFTMLPDLWPEYSGMNYLGLEGEYEDEDQNIEGEEDLDDDYEDEDQNREGEEDLEDDYEDEDQNREGEEDLEDDYEDVDQNIEGEEDLEVDYEDEDQNIEGEEDLEDAANQGPIKRPISTNQSLKDMIKSSGGDFIATIGLPERNTTESAFVPTLERRQ